MSRPTSVLVHGTFKPDGTLELDQKPDFPPGRVRVTLERVEDPSPSGSSFLEVLDQIARDQRARGFQGRTREEIDADIAALRAEDDEYEVRWERIHSQTQNPLPPRTES